MQLEVSKGLQEIRVIHGVFKKCFDIHAKQGFQKAQALLETAAVLKVKHVLYFRNPLHWGH